MIETWLLLLLWLLLFGTIVNTFVASAKMISDQERQEQFMAHNYSWPIPQGKIQPNTPGWDRLIRKRIRQVEAVETTNRIEKYDGWKAVLSQALVVPNFTHYGWAVTKAPPDLVQEIQFALQQGFALAKVEGYDPAIVADQPALLVDIPLVVERALHQLHSYFEAWAGIPLKPIRGYGMRLYRNMSQLYMHLDKIETHIISGILHIDRSRDAQPWPLVIEDLEGTTQHVYLEMGDLLFYESAKCLHGRPLPFKGSWYTSLFLHYAPRDWPFEDIYWKAQYPIPNHWEKVRPYTTPYHPPKLTMVDTAMIEPDCSNQWCGSDHSASWYGPAKSGITITSHGLEQDLNIPNNHVIDNDEL